jgi:serine phosphatase RsbU (regulator of sigma subunit)
MARLVVVQGDLPQQDYEVADGEFVLGRQPDVSLLLQAREVSRRHARIFCEDGRFVLEDLESSNGTFLNSAPLKGRAELHEQDQIRVGPYLFKFEVAQSSEGEVVIRGQTAVHPANTELFRLDPARKLQAVLEIAHQLGSTLDLDELLPKLLDHLLALFAQADRAMILMKEKEHLVVRAVRSRRAERTEGPVYSRTVAQRVLEDGMGIVAEDATLDSRFHLTQTLNRLGIRSFLCVPLKASEDRPLGVLQVDRFGIGAPFTLEDLNLLTAISMQASAVLEIHSLHAELIEKERMKRDLALAREIQEGFLPRETPEFPAGPIDLFARVYPAQQVSGDFYDYFPLDEHRLAFAVADVSGKGIPAAVFLTAVRTLGRHLAHSVTSAADFLQRLNDALAADNPTTMFVTMAFGILDTSTGKLCLSSGGHPPALIRRENGAVELVDIAPGRLLGFAGGKMPLADAHLTLAPDETLLLYSDGLTEATAPDRKTMFGVERLQSTLAALQLGQTLEAWGNKIRTAVELFSGRGELQDDVTILLLRRLGQP